MKQTLFKHLKEVKNLDSEGIFLVPSETNLNIFYAMIIGGNDTPYEGGFFMFEFNFENDYPNNPPLCTFLNTNIYNRGRVNPNTYQSKYKGKVCLSLLGTWGTKTWDPARSSIGEVLLAIKAMVFVKDPLQECEPPYKHSLYLRDGYTYSVMVLTFMDYILGTIKKMKDDSFTECYIEPFRDIILDYINENRHIYIEF